MSRHRSPEDPSPLLTVDVAHPPLSAMQAEAMLLQAWSDVRNSGTLRLLKVIHGYGSSGKGGTTREVVRSWTFRHRKKFREIIEGESYNAYHPQVQELIKEVGWFEDRDLGNANPGITVIWIK